MVPLQSSYHLKLVVTSGILNGSRSIRTQVNLYSSQFVLKSLVNSYSFSQSVLMF